MKRKNDLRKELIVDTIFATILVIIQLIYLWGLFLWVKVFVYYPEEKFTTKLLFIAILSGAGLIFFGLNCVPEWLGNTINDIKEKYKKLEVKKK